MNGLKGDAIMGTQILHTLNSLNQQINWGEYFVNQFYFKLYTKKDRADIPSYDFEKFSFSEEDQLKLQAENFVALFHEYVHYIHEMTTMTGAVGFTYELFKRALFSQYVDVPKSSDFLGIGKQHQDYSLKINNTASALIGFTSYHLTGRTVFEIVGYDFVPFTAHAPYETGLTEIPLHIPQITYKYRDIETNTIAEDTLLLGKYYIYEGLASELDKVVHQQRSKKSEKNYTSSEYNILRLLAKKLYPEIELKTMLELASLSLAYFNAGEMFIYLVEMVKKSDDKVESLRKFKETLTNGMVFQLADLKEEMDSIREVFKSRTILFSALDYLMKHMMQGLTHRINNPTFEVDLTFSGDADKLVEIIPICDYMYVFEDNDQYMRDFLGTNQDMLTSYDLKIYLCHVHYYHSKTDNSKKDVQCPMYTCCNVRHRTENPGLCGTAPWQIFDLVHTQDMEHCPYSYGVAYMKGTNN